MLRHVLRDLRNKPKRHVDQAPGNPWGSMPPDHIAAAVITAMTLAEVGAGYGALGWAYALLASFSVVYLGEHYLIDVIAGFAVAELVRRFDHAFPVAVSSSLFLAAISGPVAVAVPPPAVVGGQPEHVR